MAFTLTLRPESSYGVVDLFLDDVTTPTQEEIAEEKQFNNINSRCLGCEYAIKVYYRQPKKKDPLFLACKCDAIRENFSAMASGNPTTAKTEWHTKVLSCSEFVQKESRERTI